MEWKNLLLYCVKVQDTTCSVKCIFKIITTALYVFFFLLICIFILNFAASFLLSHYRDSIRSGLIYTQADIRYSVHFSINRSEHKMFQLVLTGKVNHFQNFYHSGEAPHLTWNNQ